MGDRSAHSVLHAPAPGPCNATRDIGHCPMWQGQHTKAIPTRGSHLYNSEMSAHAVRDLKTTKVVLVLLRAIHMMTCSDSL